MPSKVNRILIGDTLYDLTQAYVSGAQALRRDVPYSCNPHRHGSQRHTDWSLGHENESAKEHLRFNRDLLAAPNRGTIFEEDPDRPRNAQGEIASDWYEAQLSA